MIVTNKKFAAAKGYALGAIVDKAEYDEWAASLKAEQQAAYEHVMEQGNTGKGNMRVAFRHCSVGGRTFMVGETFYVSRVKGSAFGHWRLQHEPQQSTCFATMTMAELDSFSNYVPKSKEL